MKKTKNNIEKKQPLPKKTVLHKRLKGIIISDKMKKTVIVKVTTLKKHPIYQKRFRYSKKYFAHNENNLHKTGDNVIIEEIRPLSKKKRWNIIASIDK